MAKKGYRILGVDTSLRSSGVGIIEAVGGQQNAVAYGRILIDQLSCIQIACGIFLKKFHL